MRATRAYVAGLGTAGVLVVGVLLLFALVGTLVAFNGWPKLASGGSAATELLGAQAPSKARTATALVTA
ncbi:MAG: hypothetical protein ACYC0H_18885, partial [Solirubrobacteraceae bacterium]